MKKALLVVALCLASTSGSHAQQGTRRLSIATGGTGGVYYPLGGALANVLGKALPGVEATAEVTSASVDNVKLIGAGKADIAFTLGDTAAEGFNGVGKFKEKVPIRTIAVLYANKSQWVTIEGTGIEKMQDMKGHRIATGAPGSGTETIALRILEAYGMNPDKDVKREKLSVAESVNAIKDRKIDAFFWSGGVPTAAVTDLAATPGIRMKLLDHAEAIPKLVEKYGPLYVKGVIPAKAYPGQAKDVSDAEVWNLLVVHEKMDEKLVYDVVKTLFDEEARRKAEAYVEEEEGAASHFKGLTEIFLTAVAVAMSLFHLYAAYAIIPAQVLRAIHVGFVLFLTFLLFPAAKRFRNRILPWDVALSLLGVAVIAYLLVDFDDFIERAVTPTHWDLFFGVGLVLLVLEATRRTSGWILTLVVASFIAYAYAGPYLPAPWTHRGYDTERLVGQMYMTLEGIFGTAIDVSATFIILFTIYGAILQYTGAGEFFIDFSFAATGGRRAAAGRTVVLSSFLLGGPSGSGVATTVTLGSVAYPMLAKAGYGKNSAGGLLAAGGLGAIISPPVLGAAAFLIAEFLNISYLDVIFMATIPTCLYYLGLFLMVELDARKLGVRA